MPNPHPQRPFMWPLRKSNLLFVLGDGGFSKEVEQLATNVLKLNRIEFIDDNTKYRNFWDDTLANGVAPSIKFFFDKKEQNILMVPGVGSPQLKKKWTKEINYEFFGEEKRPKWVNLIDKSVYIDETVRLGKGVIIQRGCILTTNIKIGHFVTLNLNVTVGHDVTIGMYSNISPGVNISGNVVIGEGCDVGSNAVICPGVKLPPNGVIGAGAVVTNKSLELPKPYRQIDPEAKNLKIVGVDNWEDVKSYTIVGNPGKIIKINGERV